MKFNLKFSITKSLITFCFALIVLIGNGQIVKADLVPLQLCKESPSFQKRLISSTKKLENRLKLYTPESKEAYALVNKIEQTKKRFKSYANSTLFCGKEGLPRIVVMGSWGHANEFILPGILFLYIAGWIGWVGRAYLGITNKITNDYEKEIIINVPLALSTMATGIWWPFAAIQEFSAGDFTAAKEEITISPR